LEKHIQKFQNVIFFATRSSESQKTFLGCHFVMFFKKSKIDSFKKKKQQKKLEDFFLFPKENKIYNLALVVVLMF
jgi:hypothetical protein